jgi:glycerol kinase
MAASTSISRRLIGAIDQGTTSTRFIVFDGEGHIVSMAQKEHEQFRPADSQVEHDANEIWENTCQVIGECLSAASLSASDLSAVGITNQRETVVVWDRVSGEPLHPAIVWQDTRGAKICKSVASALGGVDALRERTGLPLDPYFSGSKVRWLTENCKEVRRAMEAGAAMFGTVDSWLVWKLSGGPAGGVHVTDVTNASRTLLMGLRSLSWEEDLLEHFGLPRDAGSNGMLPAIRSSSEVYASGSDDSPLPGVKIAGILGDQQAALFGQACFKQGQIKSTFGTGCFMLQNTGTAVVQSEHKLITTVAYQLGGHGSAGRPAPVYALEGSVAQAGSVVQWLRDKVGLIERASDVESLAGSVPDSGGAVMVPAFTGLFAPYWDSSARGTLQGLTGNTGRAHVARAALDSVALQATELVLCLEKDQAGAGGSAGGSAGAEMRVDGGMVANDLFIQTLADVSGRRIVRPKVIETTALGAAYAAGLAVGVWSGLEELAEQWRVDTSTAPGTTPAGRAATMAQWHKAVQRSMQWTADAEPEPKAEAESAVADDASYGREALMYLGVLGLGVALGAAIWRR